jgi:hypothetical protein
VAALVAIAEGANAHNGIATVGGDRTALLVAALVGLSGTLVAWFGPRTSQTVARIAAVTTTHTSHDTQTMDAARNGLGAEASVDPSTPWPAWIAEVSAEPPQTIRAAS